MRFYRSSGPDPRRPVTSICSRLKRTGCTAEALERRVLLADSIPIAGEFRVNSYTTSSQARPSTAMDAGGNFVVAWQSGQQDGSDYGIYAQRYTPAGVPQGSEFRVNTYVTGRQRFASIAMDSDGDFVIAWSGSGLGDIYPDGVFAQRYNAAGMPQGEEFRVNVFTAGFQERPSVAMDAEGNFVVAFVTHVVPNDYDVFVRRFDAAGLPLGDEFRVNTYTTDFQGEPSVAMDAGGDFVVAWASYGQDGSGGGIFAQRYSSSGVAQGEEFRVNMSTYGPQSAPSIAMDAFGDSVMVWTSGESDGFNVRAQRYGPNGEALGGEFRVSTSLWLQMSPSVAMDRDGDFTVAWQGYPQEMSGYGIYARRYDSAGVAISDEFHVNSHTTNEQVQAGITMNRSGDFVVAWQSAQQDGSGYGIYTQRYALVPEVTSSAFLFESSPQRLRFRFNHNVRDSLGTNDLIVENLTTGQTVPSDQFVLLYDPASDVATFIYVGAGSDAIAGVLPDGRYRATLVADGIITPQGASPAADHEFEFFFLNADANRDGRVNLRDFNILANNFGMSGTDFSRGDFTFDGTTDLEDFDILAGRFGKALPVGGSLHFGERDGSLSNNAMDDEQDSLGELLR